MLSSVFGISNGAASSESSEEALLKKQAEEMEEVLRPSSYPSLRHLYHLFLYYFKEEKMPLQTIIKERHNKSIPQVITIFSH